jgi:hypothetical protein
MLGLTGSFEEILSIRKAFEANTANGGASPFVSGESGAVLSRQFLDATFIAMVSTDASFRWMKSVPKRDVTQVLAEYNLYQSHGGGWWHSSSVGQSQEPRFKDAILKRMYDEVAYYREGFQFNKVIEQIQNVQDPEIVQGNSALRRMTEDMSRKHFFGNRSHNPYEHNGFFSKLMNDNDLMSDARGKLPESGEIKAQTARIQSREFGLANKAWMHTQTKILYDQNFETLGKQFVWQNQSQNPGAVSMGNIIDGILDGSSYGNKLLFETDLWIDRHNWSIPRIYNEATSTFVEGKTGEGAPETPAVALNVLAGPVPGSKFVPTDAGAYKYRVLAGNFFDYSVATAEDSVNIPSGGAVEITITPAVSGNRAEEFVIFRSTEAGSNVIRYMDKVKRANSGNTVYIDKNDWIPGTTIMIVGDFNSRSTSDETRTFVMSELLPPFKTLFPYGSGGKFVMRHGIVEAYNILQIFNERKFHVWKNIPVAQ